MSSENTPADYPPVFRPARPGDARAIHCLLQPVADRGLVLRREEAEIREHIERFYVAAAKDGGIVACAALRDFGDGLFEVRSLVVADSFAGCGVGSTLVAKLLEMARAAAGRQVFTLTYRPNIFLRLGFQPVDKARFPQKVWADCSICPKREHCDETALLYRPDSCPAGKA